MTSVSSTSRGVVNSTYSRAQGESANDV